MLRVTAEVYTFSPLSFPRYELPSQVPADFTAEFPAGGDTPPRRLPRYVPDVFPAVPRVPRDGEYN